MLQLWIKLEKDHCNYEPELKLIEGVFVDVFQLEVHLCSEVDQIAQVGELVVSISSNQLNQFKKWRSCDDFEELNKYDPDVNLPTIFTGAPSGILCIFRLQKQRETMKNERNGKRRKRRWIFGIFATLYKSSRRRAVHLMRCRFFWEVLQIRKIQLLPSSRSNAVERGAMASYNDNDDANDDHHHDTDTVL